MSEAPFEKEFNSFIRGMSGAEVISDLNFDIPKNYKISDYFFDDRKIIGELKCLEDDMKEKFQHFIDKKVEEGFLPQFYGKIPFNQLIRNMPDDKKKIIEQEAFEAVTSSIEDAFEQANRQVRETKNVFNLPESTGFVILFNKGNITLDPKLAVYKLHYLMNKKKKGKIRYQSLNFGIYITTKHYTNVKGWQKLFSIITLINDNLRQLTDDEESFIDSFQKRFASYKRIPIYLPKNLKIQEAIEFPFESE